MASPQTWLEVLAWTKAIFEGITSSANLYDTFSKYSKDKDTISEASRVSVAYSTFSEEEVIAILQRLKGCRDRFIEQGAGQDRARCVCSVLNEVISANGGALPVIDDWENIYATLKCKRKSA
jgi:hypothetical protein